MVVSCARAALSSSRDARVATPGSDHRHLPVPELEPHPQNGRPIEIGPQLLSISIQGRRGVGVHGWTGGGLAG